MPLPRLPYLFASCVVPLHSQEFPSMRIKLFLRPTCPCFSLLCFPSMYRNPRSIARHANVVRTKIASPGPLLCCCCMMTYLSNLVMISNTTFTNSVAKLTGSCTMPCLLCAPCTISMYPRHVRACAFLGVPCSMMHMCAPVHDVPQSLRYYAGNDSLYPR